MERNYVSFPQETLRLFGEFGKAFAEVPHTKLGVDTGKECACMMNEELFERWCAARQAKASCVVCQ